MIAGTKKLMSAFFAKENNREIMKNVVVSFFVKGLAIILNLFLTPAYMRYFNNDTALGVWFTIVSIINCILMFDLGIGNGLRNKLPKAIEENNKKEQKVLISSAYISIIVVSGVFLLIMLLINHFINWNTVLNVESSVLSIEVLRTSMAIIIVGIIFRFVLNLNSSIFFSIQKAAINNTIAFLCTLFLFIFVTFARVGDISTNFVKLSIANSVLTNIPLLIGTLYIFIGPFKGMWPKIKYYNKKVAKDILKIGTVILWLQIIFMIVGSTHAFLITSFRNPAEVVEYNVYYKIYYGLLSLFYLALTPIWSAVTKAQAKKDYKWIHKTYIVLLLLAGIFLLLNLTTIPFIQNLFDILLKEKTIQANATYALIFVFFNFCFAVHNVNTSIFNGLSDFKIQNIWMTVAAIIFIPLCYLLTNLIGNWTGVIIGSALCIVPYQIIQIVFGIKKIKKMNNE